jgi:hypothetical protein
MCCNGGKIWVGVALLFLIESCVHDPFVEPNFPEPISGCLPSGEVCFESSVLPIFVSSCALQDCHDAKTHKEGYILDNYTYIIRKGIKPGNAGESKLYKVLFETGDDRMPPDAPLTQAQKDTIAAWINQGARYTTDCNCYCDETQFTYAAIIEPMLTTHCVGCHKPGNLSSDVDLSTYNTVLVEVSNGKLLGSITHTTGFKPMPQGGKLSDCEIAQVTQWIEAGAFNN